MGARAPESRNKNRVCIEPEDSKWSLSIFEGLLDSIETIYDNHHLKNMFFDDVPSMRDKPKWMRQDSTRRAVENALKSFDNTNEVISFCGETQRLNEYYITPVIQIPNSTFIKFPVLKHKSKGGRQKGYGYRSLIHAAISNVLSEISENLQTPEPGRFSYKAMRRPEEITRIAARTFLRTPGLTIEKQCHYGVPKLPQEYFDKSSFIANYIRLFPQSSVEDSLNLWNLLQVQIKQEHGSMIVVTEDAEIEAERLNKQGTTIIPTRLSEALLRSISRIDGTILLDPYGICHAFGVILDGEANDKCTPYRGSRYNSGVRYVCSEERRGMAIVASDDKTIDIIPKIRPLVSRSLLERYVTAFNVSTIENYHDSSNWLNNHRFYINAEQCEQLNFTIARLDNCPREVGHIYIGTDKFEVDADFDESYLSD